LEDVTTLNGFPYMEMVFGPDGPPTDPDRRGTAVALAGDPGVTDLLVLSHGWNDDYPRATSLYTELTAAMAAAGGAPAGLAVLGIFWPAKQFDAASEPAATAAARAIAADPAGKAAFTEAVRAQVPAAAAPGWADPGDEQDAFFGLAPAAVFDQLGGHASVPSGVANVLDLATYYTMKARSGLVGQGLAPVLAATRQAYPHVRIHLAGHSFGARVMASALVAAPPLPVSSVTMLQGAFSHFGFARHWDGVHDGLFRPGLLGGRLAGPMVVTHSSHDQALGIAYALASRLAGQADSVLGPVGGPHDRYGALGTNGALATPESRWGQMLARGSVYSLVSGAVNNLDGSAYIPNHYDVTSVEVGQVLVAAVNTPDVTKVDGS
jgi:hypothetical protein